MRTASAHPRSTVYVGDCREAMRVMPEKSVHCLVTSPPYWGLRDYGIPPVEWEDGERCVFGLESTVEGYVRHTLEIFQGIDRVLRDDGVVWWNLGDTFNQYNANRGDSTSISARTEEALPNARRGLGCGALASGNKLLIPYRVAIALQDAGWVIREDVVWCLSGGSRLYARTQKGEMPSTLKDLVRLRPETVQLWNGSRWTQVKAWRPSTDPVRLMLTLRSGQRIGTTGSHLWPTQRGNVRADQLQKGDVIQSCVLPEPPDARTPDCLTSDTLWFLGLYLAEGSRHRKTGAADSLSLALHGDEAVWLPRLERVVSRFGGSLTTAANGNNLTVRMYGRVLVAVVEQYIAGRTSKDKHLSNAVWRLPNAALRQIIGGYLDGDGHHDAENDRWRLGFCRNLDLESDLRTAAARLGARCKLVAGFANYQGGRRPSFRGEWRWETPTQRAQYGEVVSIEAGKKGRFWDVEVEDEPHLFALASGVLTHNCKPSPMPISVDGVRWTRCRVKVAASPIARMGDPALTGNRSWAGATEHHGTNSAKWQPCPGCPKCSANGGWVLRRGRWRTTTSHEAILMITRPGGYFCDATAAAEPATALLQRKNGVTAGGEKSRGADIGDNRANSDFKGKIGTLVETRNPRSVWRIPAEPLKAKHFAAFPSALAWKCIQASTSKAGCCPACGAQWAPMVTKERVPTRPGNASKVYGADDMILDPDSPYQGHAGTICGNRDPQRHIQRNVVHGYRPTCECNAGEPVPAVVFDPFTGSGTTLQVAVHSGRIGIGCEVSEDYLAIQAERIPQVPRCFHEKRTGKPKRTKHRALRREQRLLEFHTAET